MPELGRQRSGRLVAHLVTRHQPLVFTMLSHSGCDFTSCAPGRNPKARDLQHRIPVCGRVVLGSSSGRQRNDCSEINRFAGVASTFGRIDEAVTTYPHQ